MCDFILNAVPVTKPYLLMSDASPVEGSTMWMRCNLDNGTGPIQYVWKHETRNGTISVVAQGTSSIINVTDVNRNHTGWYRCVASNAVNSESSNRLWLDTICEYFEGVLAISIHDSFCFGVFSFLLHWEDMNLQHLFNKSLLHLQLLCYLYSFFSFLLVF